MALDPVDVGQWRPHDCVRIKPGHATRPVRWLTGAAANVTPGAGALLGSTALAGTGLVGGSRFHSMIASNTDATNANTLKPYVGKPMPAANLTTVGNFGTVSITTTTVTRSTGSFVTDGWAVDDFLIVDGATSLANNFGAVLTAVSATTLTFASIGTNVAENLPVTASLWRGFGEPLSAIAINAGNAAATAGLDLLSDNKPTGDSVIVRQKIIGAGDAYFLAVGTTMAAGKYVDAIAIGGNY